jgi:hypothetical protein
LASNFYAISINGHSRTTPEFDSFLFQLLAGRVFPIFFSVVVNDLEVSVHLLGVKLHHCFFTDVSRVRIVALCANKGVFVLSAASHPSSLT